MQDLRINNHKMLMTPENSTVRYCSHTNFQNLKFKDVSTICTYTYRGHTFKLLREDASDYADEGKMMCSVTEETTGCRVLAIASKDMIVVKSNLLNLLSQKWDLYLKCRNYWITKNEVPIHIILLL